MTDVELELERVRGELVHLRLDHQTLMESGARAEARLRRQEERYRSLVYATSQIVWTNTAEGEMRGPNPDWGAFTGQTEDEYQGYGWSAAVHPEDAQPTIDAWNCSVAARTPFVFRHRVRRHDGVYRPFSIHAVPVLDADGSLREWVGIHSDITEQLQTERDERESQIRKSAILEAALDSIITIDEQERVIEWNPAAERMFGYPRAQALGRPLSSLIIPPVLRGAHAQGMAHYFRTGEGPVLNTRVEVPGLRADGTEFPVELAVIPIVMDGSTLFTAYLRDLTERAQAEEERRRAADRQRAFLRDVLASVTEGRLILCFSPDELPIPLSLFSGPCPISMAGGLQGLRHAARAAAEAAGLASERSYDLETAVGEAGMNAVVHVGEGMGQIYIDSNGIVQVWVVDQGPGIALEDLPHATLQKGYTTAGTLGHGMKMMLAVIDRLYLLTGATGTTVVLEQGRLGPHPAFADVLTDVPSD